MSKKQRASFRITDLFAGAGGLTYGLIAGDKRFRPHQAVEIDLDAAATYTANFASAEVVNVDIKEWVVNGEVKTTDVVVGGPPCQGFSTLGKQEVDDEKNQLWHQYAQIVEASDAKYFIMENVPQFETSPQKLVFEEELDGGFLKNYSASFHIVNTKDFGSPQSRKRLIVLGSRKDLPRFTFPAPTTLFGSNLTVRDAFRGLSQKVTEIDLPERTDIFNGKKRPGPFKTSELHLTRDFSETSRKRFVAIPEGGNRFDLPDELKAPCWIKHTSGSGDVMGRLRWDEPSVTIRTEFNKPEKGRYLHPVENRAITHQEAARLMGFPDDYLWVGSKTSIARQIGNAVPIPLGKVLGEKLAGLLEQMM